MSGGHPGFISNHGPAAPARPSHVRGYKIMEEVSSILVGALVLILGFVGLFLASGALDSEMYVFGLGLAGFAAVFDIGLIKAHFDRKQAAHRGQAG